MVILTISLSRVRAFRPKVDATLEDVREGRLSHSTAHPISVSRLDSCRGGYFIVDGHHRVVEAIARGERTIRATVDVHVPRIERTGGAYRSWTDHMCRVVDAVPRVTPV